MRFFSAKGSKRAAMSSASPETSTVAQQHTTQPSTSSTGGNVGVRPPRGGLTAEQTRTLGDKGERPQTINVVIFGETGVGKSAVVNLIAQKVIAAVSPDANCCTMKSTHYDVSFDDIQFRIFDTAGLNEPYLSRKSHSDAVAKARDLIFKLKAAGGIHLLLFCMRMGKMTPTTQKNYQLFSEFFCQQRVPVGVVVTNCEREEDMEGWWSRNGTEIERRYGIKSHGHACITAVSDGTPGEESKYRESQQRVRELLKSCFLKTDAFLPDETDWLAMTEKGLDLIKKGETPKMKDAGRGMNRVNLW